MGPSAKAAGPLCLFPLPERKHQLDGNEDRYRLAESRARLEAPLARGADRFLVEAECRIEGTHHLAVAGGPVLSDDAFEIDGTLHFGAHGFCRVGGLDFLQKLWGRDAVAGAIGTTAGTSAGAGTKTRAGARSNAASCAGP